MTFNKTLFAGAIAVVGVAVTGALSFRAGLKAAEVLREKELEEAEIKVKVEATVKEWVPPVIAGGITIISVAALYKMGMAEITALTAGCGYLSSHKAKLERKLKEYLPEEEFKKVKNETTLETLHPEDDLQVPFPEDYQPYAERTGNGDQLVVLRYSGRVVRTSFEAAYDAVQKFNDAWDQGEYLCFNDFYRYLDVLETHFGDQWGYANDGGYYDRHNPLLKAELVENPKDFNEPILCIEIMQQPMECWMDGYLSSQKFHLL